MRSHNHPIILFIDRSGFSVFQDTLTNIPKFNFTPDLVANLDVVNKEQFSNLIATFIQINKIVPSSFAVILSDTVIYVKDLVRSQSNPEQDQKDEVQNFLENVPFEEVLAKVIKTEQKNTLAVVNKDLVMTIADVFVNNGSVIEAVVPGFLFQPKANFTLGLTQENIQAVLAGSEILREGNLLTDQQKVVSPQNLDREKKDQPAEGSKKPQNLRQYILIGVFVTLLVILIVVYLNLGASQNPPVKKINSYPVQAVSSPTVVPTLAQVGITTAPFDLKSVKIKIVQNTQSDAIVSSLKDELAKGGFENVVSETFGGTVPEKSSILFSQNIPSNIRDKTIAAIKKIIPDVSILENQDTNSTITVLIGKS